MRMVEQGLQASTHCLEDSDNMFLNHCRKVIYVVRHSFLPTNHSLRKKGEYFEGKEGRDTKPIHYNGKCIFSMIIDVEVVLGKGSRSPPLRNDENGHAKIWKKSIFLGLPY